MSTTQKLSIKGLKIGKDQYDLLVSTIKGLVGEAGTVTAKEKLSDGLELGVVTQLHKMRNLLTLKFVFMGPTLMLESM